MSTSGSREWMKIRPRDNTEYVKGVQEFMIFAKGHSPPDTATCICPCLKCRNSKKKDFATVENHLFYHGIDPSYNKWYLHGEENNVNLMADSTQNVTKKTCIPNQVEEENYVGDLGNFVDDAFEMHDRTENVEDGIHWEKYHEYKNKANEKLYPSCEASLTTLNVIIELHNLKKEFNWSGNSVTELLKRLKKWLPVGNTLPKKYPVMKRMLKDLGMEAKRIHACENDCILFWKEYENAVECPRCHTSRFKDENINQSKLSKIKGQPRKVLRYFPLSPRLSRLYTIPWIARKMLWHSEAKPCWEFMRHPIDSAEWRSIKIRWPEFSKNGRNVWLGIATDGFNPSGALSSNYSCWPVYVVPYNLPPSLCMKPEFQMLCLLIPGPKAPSQDIDVYLDPLIDELEKLWIEGVSAFDMDKKEHFNLKAMLMWGIHDFPAFGNLSGCVTHGYKACPICAMETDSEHIGKKIVYTNYRRFLKIDHPYRDLKHGWYKDIERRNAPTRLTGPLLVEKLNRVNYVPGKILKNIYTRVDDDENDDENTDERTSWYKKSILFNLEYWSSHKVRHTIDVMHTEKNVAEHLINLLFDKSKQHSRFAFDKKFMTKCCQLIKDTKLPSCIRTKLRFLASVQPPTLYIKKSYDYHVIIQHFLPVMVQHAYPKSRDVKRAILQVCLYFNIICSKVLVREHVQAAKDMISEALCVLVHYFPAQFFDISIHLMVHLADQALLCGPVTYTWMYPFERAMKGCKNLPSNKRYVEGSISEAYLVSESVGYAMEYMPNPCTGNHSSTQASFLNDDDDDIYERSIIEGKNIKLTNVQRIQIRRWILFRLDIPDRDDYYSEYRSSFQNRKRLQTTAEVVVQSEFIDWLHIKLLDEKCMDSMLWCYVSGPKWEAKTYLKYRINGYIFSPKHYDDTVSTQDSGVCMDAITTFVASVKDLNPMDENTTWYGIIKEIIEVDYYETQHVLFYCEWVNVADKTNGCKICPESNLLMVNLKKLKNTKGEYEEPAILASEASQVFYIRDVQNPDWSIVRRSPKRMTDMVDDYEKPSNFQSVLKEQPNLVPLLKCIELK